jgi:hypothetical protein
MALPHAAEGADLAVHLQVLLLQGKVTPKGLATAYICEKRVCELPTSNPEVFARQIQKVEPLKAAAGPGALRHTTEADVEGRSLRHHPRRCLLKPPAWKRRRA